MVKQPEALRLADSLDAEYQFGLTETPDPLPLAAAELRRLHALNAELVDVLRKCKTAALPTEVRDLVNAAIGKD